MLCTSAPVAHLLKAGNMAVVFPLLSVVPLNCCEEDHTQTGRAQDQLHSNSRQVKQSTAAVCFSCYI